MLTLYGWQNKAKIMSFISARGGANRWPGSYRTTWERLATTPLPGIAVLNDGSFLFIGKVGDDKAIVQSPLSPRPVGMPRPERTLRAWTKEDIRTLKTLAREKAKTTVIARKVKRSVDATRHKASALGVSLGGGQGGKRV
jgi:hypothetical protein